MFSKKDPMVDSVKAIMERSAKLRQAERRVNESFGIMAKEGLPHEKRAEYDRRLKIELGRVLSEGTITEAMKLKGTHTSPDGKKVAKVYHDKEWEEFRVKHYTDGKHNAKADYHTGDADDAHSTAKHWVNSDLKESVDKKKIEESVSLRSIQEEIYKNLVRKLNTVTDKDAFIRSLSEEQVSIISVMEEDMTSGLTKPSTMGRPRPSPSDLTGPATAASTTAKSAASAVKSYAKDAIRTTNSVPMRPVDVDSAVKSATAKAIGYGDNPDLNVATKTLPTSDTVKRLSTSTATTAKPAATPPSAPEAPTTSTTAKPAATPTNAPDSVAPPGGGSSAGSAPDEPTTSPASTTVAAKSTGSSSGNATTTATAAAAKPASTGSSSGSSSSRQSDREMLDRSQTGGRFSDQPAWAAKAFTGG